MTPIISLRNLTHIYQPGPLQKIALQEITLDIAAGSCTAIIGVTGSGKSTLVQHFNGLLLPTHGTVIVDGLEVKKGSKNLTRLRQRVGLVFQTPEAQLFAQTVFAEIAFGPRRLKLSPREVHKRVNQTLTRVGLPLPEYGRRSPFSLSGGQMRRIALASVLAMQPKVLVLDEPTVGLDNEAKEEFYHYVRQIKEVDKVTVIIISHDMAEVMLLADQIVILANGRLVAQGTPSEIFNLSSELAAWGLAPPPFLELINGLRGENIPISVATFTIPELVRQLQEWSETGKLC